MVSVKRQITLWAVREIGKSTPIKPNVFYTFKEAALHNVQSLNMMAKDIKFECIIIIILPDND